MALINFLEIYNADQHLIINNKYKNLRLLKVDKLPAPKEMGGNGGWRYWEYEIPFGLNYLPAIHCNNPQYYVTTEALAGKMIVRVQAHDSVSMTKEQAHDAVTLYVFTEQVEQDTSGVGLFIWNPETRQLVFSRTSHEVRGLKCKKGLHFCENPLDVFTYYSPNDGKFAEIEADDVSPETGDDSKRVAKKLTVKTEINLFKLVKLGVEYIKTQIDWDNNKESNTGDYSAATNTGDRSAATNTGDYSAATNTGDRSAATNTGYRSAATNTGYRSAATNTGDR